MPPPLTALWELKVTEEAIRTIFDGDDEEEAETESDVDKRKVD